MTFCFSFFFLQNTLPVSYRLVSEGCLRASIENMMQPLLKMSLAAGVVTAANPPPQKKRKKEMADTVRALILVQMENQASGAGAHRHSGKQHQWLRGDVHRCF